MDLDRQALLDRFERAAERMATQTRVAAMKDWSEIDLTMSQLRAMGFLGDTPKRMGDIAAFLGSSVSSATSLIERLAAKGLVERVHDPIDRRVVMCHVTASGRVELDRIWRAQRLHREMLADILTLEELEKVIEVLELLANAVERRALSQSQTGGESPSDIAPG